MSGVPAKRAATYEDLLKVPEHLVAEIIDGELITSPPSRRAARRGSVVAGCSTFTPPSAAKSGRGGPGGWVISPRA